MNKEQLMIENEILKLEIMKRDNIIRHKNKEIDTLRARKTVYKHEMKMSNAKFFLHRLNIVVHAYNDFKDAMNAYDDLIYDYHQITDEVSYMLKRESILQDVTKKKWF